MKKNSSKPKKKVWKYIRRAFLIYLAFILAGSTIPYLFSAKVSDDAKDQFTQTAYYSETTGPERAALIETPEEALAIRIQLLRSAEHTLDISYLSMDEGETTSVFMAELLAAADRGVQIRLILDGKVGCLSRSVSTTLSYLNSHENISVKLYNTVNLLTPWKWHALLHDKFILADQEYLLLGGRNLNDKYFAPESYDDAITNDRDVLIWNTRPDSTAEESAVLQAAAYMEIIWDARESSDKSQKTSNSGMEKLRSELEQTAGTFEIQNKRFYEITMSDFQAQTVATNKVTLISNPVHTYKKEPWVGYQLYLLGMESSAVTIQTPYATANKGLLNSLTEITNGDASVTMITNSLASTPNFPAFSNYYTQRQKFLDTDISIYEYQSTHSIHGKSIIFDNRLSAVGSLNLDDRSLYIDTETMLLIDSEEFAAILGGAIADIQKESLLVASDNIYEGSTGVPEAPVSSAKKVLIYIVSLISRPFGFLMETNMI